MLIRLQPGWEGRVETCVYMAESLHYSPEIITAFLISYIQYKIKIKKKNINWDRLCKHLGLPDSSVGKESSCSAGDPSSIPGSGRSSGEG